MNTENIKLFKSVPLDKIHLQKRQHTIDESYHPNKCKKGIYCTGDQFDYVVPWEVRKRPTDTASRERVYS